MEDVLGYILIGVIIGLVVIFMLSQAQQNEENAKRLNWSQGQDRLQNQRDAILNELTQKSPENTETKTEAVHLIYQFAASKNNFTLKDIEACTKQLQNHYLKNLEINSQYKMNFPEKELLNFEPRETLTLLTIINEGLHNATVHASSNFIFSIASIEDGKLNIITHDNGVGYNRKEIPDGAGINKISKATQELNGDLKLTSTAGNGTVVNVEIPIKKS